MAAGDRIPCARAFAALRMYTTSPAGRANRLIFMVATSQLVTCALANFAAEYLTKNEITGITHLVYVLALVPVLAT